MVHLQPASLVLYNPTSATFITAAGTTVRIWDGCTGGLLKVYSEVCSSAVTTMCLDDRQRKFLLGTHSGEVLVFDYINGSYMKTLYRHASEVTSVMYCAPYKCVVSTSWDRSVVVSDELPLEGGKAMKVLTNAHMSDITAATVSIDLSLIATGESTGLIHVWDFEFLRLEVSCVGHLHGIRALAFVAPYPALVSAGMQRSVFPMAFCDDLLHG